MTATATTTHTPNFPAAATPNFPAAALPFRKASAGGRRPPASRSSGCRLLERKTSSWNDNVVGGGGGVGGSLLEWLKNDGRGRTKCGGGGGMGGGGEEVEGGGGGSRLRVRGPAVSRSSSKTSSFAPPQLSSPSSSFCHHPPSIPSAVSSGRGLSASVATVSTTTSTQPNNNNSTTARTPSTTPPTTSSFSPSPSCSSSSSLAPPEGPGASAVLYSDFYSNKAGRSTSPTASSSPSPYFPPPRRCTTHAPKLLPSSSSSRPNIQQQQTTSSSLAFGSPPPPLTHTTGASCRSSPFTVTTGVNIISRRSSDNSVLPPPPSTLPSSSPTSLFAPFTTRLLSTLQQPPVIPHHQQHHRSSHRPVVLPPPLVGRTASLSPQRYLCPLLTPTSSSSSTTQQPTFTGASVVQHASGVSSIRLTVPADELLPSSALCAQHLISEGGFGSVYCMLVLRQNNRRRAVKVTTGSMSGGRGGKQSTWLRNKQGKLSNEQMQNFVREVNAYRCLVHPNITRYFGACVERQFLAIVMEYLPNGNVHDLLHKTPYAATAAVRLKLAQQLVDVVCYLHNRSPVTVHGDLKTANFVLDRDLNLKLCDFGKTREIKEGFCLPSNFGSPRYMAPECFLKRSTVNEQGDIWSLACCLIEILGGPIPFEQCRTHRDVKVEIFHNKNTPLVPPHFHPHLKATLTQCFRMDAEDRPRINAIACVVDALTVGDVERYGMDCKQPKRTWWWR
eukprot:GHVS01091901.1.p1 GENE.GHVS01091901.1~~GHVS01091901.1.p1  ORF type:complete len:790 (+),score=192.89 GHVS01091901.1:187-2370(+)